MESEMKEVTKELPQLESRPVLDEENQEQQQQPKRHSEVGGEISAASAVTTAAHCDAVAAEHSKGDVSAVDDGHRGSPISVEDSEAPVASTGKKRAKKGRLWKKNRGKQKSNVIDEAQSEGLPICVEEPQLSTSLPPDTTTTMGTGTSTSSAVKESEKTPEKEDDHVSGNAQEVPQTNSTADFSEVDHQSGSHATTVGRNEPLVDILDFDEEQMHQIEAGLAAASARPTLEWGLCGEDDRGPPVRTPPRTPPHREPRGKNKQQGQGQGREQAAGAPPPGHQSQSPREPWKRKPMESRGGGRHESLRSSSISQPQSPAVTVDAQKLEGMSEWNRIKAMQHNAAAEVASHKNWVPRKGIQRGIEVGGGGVDQNKGRGKGKQGRVEQVLQHSHHTKELARQKFEADLRIKQEELLQRSKQTLKAEIQKVKKIEATRKGRDELELELERNLVYLNGELIYLNQ
ncbi:hypothetical protein MPTK1_7g05680 [Marchantia polymorpha subsp. ruderalis]|nr:hypothetical protein MARPO_0057s0103 [Marchantia polymorpha]BBN16356.1 hypothetical protein Mp_7g05680 [Marchantia polymorpha subsp. ruderalis]|eukprot:PTQ37502.1 hypothetical protein MARPO_0057s0103 [Marchantia polymorpha]